MTTVYTIAPWRDALHLLPAYAKATEGTTPVIVWAGDGGAQEQAQPLAQFVAERGGLVLLMPRGPFSLARAYNAGLLALHEHQGVAVCLHNDVQGDGAWVQDAAALPHGVLASPDVLMRAGAGQPYVYPAGWCVGATLTTWRRLSGWDGRVAGRSLADAALGLRAIRANVRTQRRPWTLRHREAQSHGPCRHSLYNGVLLRDIARGAV